MQKKFVRELKPNIQGIILMNILYKSKKIVYKKERLVFCKRFCYFSYNF